MKEEIITKEAPEPIGPYSQAIRVENLIFLSGIIPVNPKTGEVINGDIKQATEQIFKNASAILKAAGASLENVVKVTVFLKDLKNFEEMNKVYSNWFKKPYPARTTVQVAALPKEVDVEMDFIAEI
ncbi:MAG: RidA family protein [Thermoproteota archaeon]|nr:RidA family protein [Candidatus Brockarchaeota archaeon]MBO3762766.1 RidA family protein [Candidatus Brockarchaeota archaeon]MBO3768531.1 RidA family protein [Candidatus Brockarchaeota archaeon]MBO3801337.1 RidA family protein [Candidatus Brockarchaeota archaeon]